MAGVVIVLGEERFLAREAIAFVLADRGAADVVRYEGDAADPAAVLDDVRTPSLLGGGRAVVVENAGPLLEGDALAALASYAGRPAPGATLVLQAARLDMRLRGAKPLKEAADVVECRPVPAREVAGWIRHRGRSTHGLDVGHESAEALRAALGDDLGSLDSALGRLREQIAPRRRVAPEDVTGSTEDHRSPVIFEATNALESADLDGCLQALRSAFREGVRVRQDVVTEPKGVASILLSTLHRSYCQILRHHMLLRQGHGEREAAERSGVTPRAAPYFAQRARRHRLDTLLARHVRFVEADLALKRSGDHPRLALEHLLLRLLVG